MKKTYISPEMLMLGFQAQSEMMFVVSDGTTVGAGNSLSPEYNEEDEEDWGDEDPANGKVYW